MPTFTDPTTDAAEASEALRGLVHATIHIDQSEQIYPVLGDLLAGVRSLRQVLDQLASTYVGGQPRAFDDHGDAETGTKNALAAVDELHQDATLIDAAHDRCGPDRLARARNARAAVGQCRIPRRGQTTSPRHCVPADVTVAVFDPQHLAEGLPAGLRWSPVRGCEDPLTAIIRATGLSAGGVESGGF